MLNPSIDALHLINVKNNFASLPHDNQTITYRV